MPAKRAGATAAIPCAVILCLATVVSPLDGALYEAANRGYFEEVTSLLDAGADANAPIPGDGSALIAAARRGDLEIARLLIRRGADPNLAVPGDGSALIAAARNRQVALVTLLLDSGATVDQVVDGDEHALIQASGGGHLAVVRLLVERGADVNARVLAPTFRGGDEWRSPLSMATRRGHADVVAFLTTAGAQR